MAIDLANTEKFRKLTREDLINDAVERNDKNALRWLEDEFFKEVPVKDKEGNPTDKMKPNPLVSIRAEYLRKFLGYVPNQNKPNSDEAKAKAKAEREAQLRKTLQDAFNKLNGIG